MAAIKVLLSKLSKTQKAQLKEMEAEARKNASGATQRDHLAILLNDPTIAIRPQRGRKAVASPKKTRKRGAGPITQAKKRARAQQTAISRQDPNSARPQEPSASRAKGNRARRESKVREKVEAN